MVWEMDEQVLCGNQLHYWVTQEFHPLIVATKENKKKKQVQFMKDHTADDL